MATASSEEMVEIVSASSEEMVEIVSASPDPDHEPQEEIDVTAHQDSEKAMPVAAEIKKALRELQTLCDRISKLLGPAGPHRVVATGDAGRRCLAFMETELSTIAPSLTTLGLQHFDNMETKQWLQGSLFLVRRLVNRIIREVEPSHRTLRQRASQCFRFHFRKSYSDWVPEQALVFYYINEHPYRYRHLLLTSSDLGLTPQRAEAVALLPLVGIDRAANKIFRWFTHQVNMDTSLRVMSIVGPVGIGKTTLAVEVRNRLIRHETRSGGCHYDCKVMAQASWGAHRNILLLHHILSQVADPAAPALSSHQSQCNTMELLLLHVSECLQHKRYIIIIDNLCKESDWEEIKGAFPNNNLGSLILITTRITSVAEACCSGSYDGVMHKMKPLNQIDSEKLLLSKVVGYEDGCLPDNMKLFCEETLRRCDGIPLFIIEMADWMKEQPLQQREDEDTEHQRFVMHYGWLPERLEQALSSAFSNFPIDGSRLLLLYMSMFPCGYKFEKDRLILKWIHESRSQNLGFAYGPAMFNFSATMSEAETFFSQLVDMNVLTCVASNCKHKQDEAEDCQCQWQVNHFMQQFLASKSAEMGFFFTTTLNRVAPAAAHHSNETKSRMPRRLALHHPIPQLLSLLETLDLTQTRSLYVSGTVSLKVSPASSNSPIPLDKFINLVVLDLEGWENLKDEDLLQVCRRKMFFLRYLSIRNTRVRKLPHEVKELQSLRTLDVSYTQITELPLEVFELRDLKHIDLRGTRISLLPKQIVGLQYRLEVLLVGGEGTINSIETKLIVSGEGTNQLPNRTVGLQGELTGLLVGGEGTINCVETATRLPHEVRHLKWQEALATVDLTEHPASFVRALGDLRYLRVLAVRWSFHQSTDKDSREALVSSIKNWEELESLTIHCGLGCSMEFLGCSLEKSCAPWRLQKFKVTAGRFASVPPWIDGLEHLAFVQITVCTKKTAECDLKILGDLPELQCLILALGFIPGQPIVIKTQGFSKLQRFALDCVLPWLTFQTGAMPLLTHLQLKFSSGPASEDCVPSGITDLQRIREVVLSYSKWCVSSTTVKMAVKAVREQVAKHRNPIDLFINGVEDDYVQAVDEEAEDATGTSSSGTDARPKDDAQAVDQEVKGVGQIEIAEDEN